jgi:hypothetical protein
MCVRCWPTLFRFCQLLLHVPVTYFIAEKKIAIDIYMVFENKDADILMTSSGQSGSDSSVL